MQVGRNDSWTGKLKAPKTIWQRRNGNGPMYSARLMEKWGQVFRWAGEVR